jgi:glycosyltransferase involved in cell wall biosynthesis
MENQNPDISYILCIYRSYGIENGLYSIINQKTNTEISREVIIVNDASQDDAIEISCNLLDKFSVSYKVVNNDTNYGPSISFNIGARNASGNYLVFMDADDFIPSQVEEKTLDILKTEKGDWLFGKTYKIIDDIGEKEMDHISDLNNMKYLAVTNNILNYVLTKTRIAATYLMVEEELFERSGGFDEKCFIQDVPIFLRLAINSKKLIYCENYLFYFKRSVDSLSSKLRQVNGDGFLSQYNFLKEHSGRINSIDQEILRKKLLSSLVKSFKRMKVRSGNYQKVLLYYVMNKLGRSVNLAKIVELRKNMPTEIIPPLILDDEIGNGGKHF